MTSISKFGKGGYNSAHNSSWVTEFLWLVIVTPVERADVLGIFQFYKDMGRNCYIPTTCSPGYFLWIHQFVSGPDVIIK